MHLNEKKGKMKGPESDKKYSHQRDDRLAWKIISYENYKSTRIFVAAIFFFPFVLAAFKYHLFAIIIIFYYFLWIYLYDFFLF